MIKNSDINYFNKAKKTAMISDFSRTHIGCIAVYQGNIIGIGCNTNKTHPYQKYCQQNYMQKLIVLIKSDI